MCSTLENVDAGPALSEAEGTRRRGDPEIGAFSPRLSLGLLLLAIAAAGCSTQPKVRYEPVNNTPVIGDEAMAMRNWPPSISHYQNGEVAAWSTRFTYQPNPNRPEAQNILLDPVMFLGQVAVLPLEFVANPPFDPRVYHGIEYRPTYTAQPPLPPEGGGPPGGVDAYR